MYHLLFLARCGHVWVHRGPNSLLTPNWASGTTGLEPETLKKARPLKVQGGNITVAISPKN